MTINPGPPDFDRMSADELKSLAGAIRRHPIRTARRLFPHRPTGYVSATKDLARMMVLELQARQLQRWERENGPPAPVHGTPIRTVPTRTVIRRIRESLPEYAKMTEKENTE